ncbi:MAG TPA: hypothetical protein VIR34_09855 [Gemmatimonadaceae bacterium]|jgi:hypothetical protein
MQAPLIPLDALDIPAAGFCAHCRQPLWWWPDKAKFLHSLKRWENDDGSRCMLKPDSLTAAIAHEVVS